MMIPQCCIDDLVCITCSDSATPMRVEAISGDGMLAECTDGLGHRSDVMLGVVSGIVVGSEVLVHAGAALVLIGTPAAERSALASMAPPSTAAR
ncbi:MAG TPA: HypC/HybG/HupF family hydrogenase formation chaperone [Gemmatimonadaceae bacterium]|jgi:hydrogenase maturation factor|nr:HypC/HybG/HupF family hydrogenase formation chaperone [Gemmatimonadaceae bacterium]